MAEPKTQPTSETLASFLKRIEDTRRRADCKAVAGMMATITKAKAVVMSTGIVGFGTYDVTYAGGKTGSWPALALAPRKGDLTLYLSKTVMADSALMAALGKATQKGGCLHIKQLADVNLEALHTLMTRTYTSKTS